jgi:hypothetical protein
MESQWKGSNVIGFIFLNPYLGCIYKVNCHGATEVEAGKRLAVIQARKTDQVGLW